MSRAKDDKDHFVRSERVFSAGGQWYFQTREGIDVGPYPTREAAQEEAARLARVHQMATHKDTRS